VARYRRGERERVWREVIRDQAVSGLSISAFCRDREVSPGSFFNWRRKLADRELEREDSRHHSHATDHAVVASKFVALDFPTSKVAVPKVAMSKVTVAGAGLLGASRMESSVDPRTVSRTGCEVVLPNGCRVIVPVQCDASWLRELLAAVRDTAVLVSNISKSGPSC